MKSTKPGQLQVALDPCTDTTRYPVQAYLMPAQEGAITITQVRGGVIGFTTAQGATGSFAYATGQFQS
ncbi:MAG TPA: hypothetical protein VFY89_04365 [Ktedonobacterales bacterium]